jgi:hypothetical protein
MMAVRPAIWWLVPTLALASACGNPMMGADGSAMSEGGPADVAVSPETSIPPSDVTSPPEDAADPGADAMSPPDMDAMSPPDMDGAVPPEGDAMVSRDGGIFRDGAIMPRDASADRVIPTDGGCPSGTAECDRDPATMCETRIDTILHCGACGRACARRTNANASCGPMGCAYACTEGFGDCNMNAGDGCETRLDTAMNCGACGRACSGATPVCNAAMGMCVAACPMGSMTCGAGSCVNLQTSVGNCGACRNECFVPNSIEACVMGRCAVGSCLAGFGNCNMTTADGCEANLNTEARNCGRCGNRCVDAPNGRGECLAGSCGLICAANFGNCDGMIANGCETRLTESNAHCGACGNACPAGQRCTFGRCR